MLKVQHRRSPGFCALLALVLFLCYGCGGSSAPDSAGASGSGRLALRLSPAATPQRTQLRPSTPLQIQAEDIDALRITVASTALAAPLVFDCDLSSTTSGPCEVTETPTEFMIAIEIVVPRNADLLVTVTIFDANGAATFEGTRTIRLTQGIQSEDIVLAPVDNDGDGFSEAQGDCDDTNASIRPGATDIPGNGIDEDCDGGDAPVANIPPVANAGPDQTVPIGATVTLTGQMSSDVDGDRLRFRWLLTNIPANSTAVLRDATAVTPTFEADLDGDYIAQLTVNDGTIDSAADAVIISTRNSKPVAHAGPDQTVRANTTVHLDGTASSDVDGNPLAFQWSLLSRPQGSTASLTNRTALTPTLNVDLPGAYVVQLVVNAGALASEPDTVTITTSNALPVAHAGPDQVVTLGTTVTLTAQHSSDVNGDMLTPQWALLVTPAGSTATLSDPTAVNPTFVADRDGVYVAQLMVHDGTVTSPPATVIITTTTSTIEVLPVANAGPDQTITVPTLVQLDGIGSRDANGSRLSFFWALTTRPSGSEASLSAPTAPNPTLTVDVAGTYVAQLVVNNGTGSSMPDTVVLSTGNLAPVANAGPDQTATVGELVQLDGSGSHDANSDLLTFAWALIFAPSDSAASLSNTSSANPTFTLDVPGIYVVQLMVNDGTLTSAPTTVVISTTNSAPVAQAGPDQLVSLESTVQLDGSASGDVDDDPLTFFWVFVALPPGSTATLSNPRTVNPTFAADRAGTYILQLVVHDGALQSAPDSVVITASSTLMALSLPLTLRVPLGQTTAIPVTIPAPAPAGGVVVNLSSSDPALIAVTTPTVTIPSGALSVNGRIQGGAVGTTTITANNANFVAATTQATTTSADLFFTPRETTLDAGFPTSITIQLQSAGSAIAAPSNVTVALQAAAPGCVAVPATVTIPRGLVNASVPLSYGGSASVPCSTTVTANATNFLSDSLTVTVRPQPVITIGGFPLQVGAGLQTSCCFVSLGAFNHPGTTVRLESSDPSRVRVAPDSTTPGQAFINVPLPPTQTRFNFVVQGLEQARGAVTLTASAAGFQNGTITINVVQPGVQLGGLSTKLAALAADENFVVRLGLPAAGNTRVANFQQARVGGNGFQATITTSDSEVGALVPGNGSQVNVGIAAGQDSSDVDAVAFRPLSVGTTTVAVSIPQFIATTAASVDVSVTSPAITLANAVITVGAGLQTPTFMTGRLSHANHEGVTVRIASSNPALALIAPDDSTPGQNFIDVTLADGEDLFIFVVQGLERVTGTTALQVSAPGFTAATCTLTVVQPTLSIVNLEPSTISSAPNNDFEVGVGIPDSRGTRLQEFQPARAGGGGFTATLRSSNPSIGRLVTTATTGQSVTVRIAAGDIFSPFGLAAGGVAFDPVRPGTTIVSASINNFIPTNQTAVTVEVGSRGLQLLVSSPRLGAGLQTRCCNVSLNDANHGGVTVRVTSSNRNVLLLAPDDTTAGTAFIDIPVPDRQSNFSFVVQGRERATGTVTLTASAPGFTAGTGTITVEQPALALFGLFASTTLAANEAFQVGVGLPDSSRTFLQTLQVARIGGGGLLATMTNSAAVVGQLMTEATIGQTVTVAIDEGQALGGDVAFDPLSSGTTIVAARIPDFIATSNATAQVTVDAPHALLFGLPTTVGAGLQTFCCLVNLNNGSDHGGVTVRVASSTPSVVLVAPDAVTPGTAFIDVLVPDGQTNVPFVVQGVERARGTALVTASAPGFVNATGTVTVEQAALVLSGLALQTTSTAADDAFVVTVGLPDRNNFGLRSFQEARAGGGGLTATLSSSDTRAGQLVTTASTGGQVSIQIPAGSVSSPGTVALGGVAFDAVAAGATIVRARIPGFFAPAAASQRVLVTP